MKGAGHIYIRFVVLLHLLWCCGICPSYAQTDEARPDTVQHEPRRARKQAVGRVKERRPQQPVALPSPTDSTLADSTLLDSVLLEKSKNQALDDSLQHTAVDSILVPVDSAAIVHMVDSLKRLTWAERASRFKPDPVRATWLALAFPGGGQIYNRKYWKLPIVYGGFLGCVYALTWNNQMLRDYQQAYLDIMDSDPTTCSYLKMLPMGYDITGRESRFQQIFKTKKDFYRKYRDLSIFAFAGVYIISVIDAYVDAELSTFDISPDLSFHWGPSFIETGFSSPHHCQRIPAVQCQLFF